MSNLLFSFNAVAPVFLLVGIGWLVRKIGWIDERFVGTASRLNFRTGLPALMFLGIYNTQSIRLFDWKFVSLMSAACIVSALMMFLTVPRFVKDKRKASAIVHTVFKPNVIVLGFPMMIMMFGETNSAPMSMLMPVMVPINNVLAVLILCAMDPTNEGEESHQLRKSLTNIIKNPIIIAAVAAILLKALSVQLPQFLFKLVSSLGNMATPLALITLGAQMTMKSVLSDRKYVALATVCKVLITPLILVPIAYLMGFRSYELATAFIVAAAPSAVNCYMLAREMHSDEVLTGEIILSTTLSSMFVLFIGIFILKSLAVIS